MAEPEQLRLFLACELPDEVRAALGRIQDDLRRRGAGRLRWVRPDGIHLTLKFLGSVEAPLVDKITAALAVAIAPFELRVQPGRLGGFGGGRIRVVWVGLEGDVEGLVALAGCVDRALQPLGFPSERRPFAAHLTLARVPDAVAPAERRAVAELVGGVSLSPQPSMVLRHVALMRSVLGPGGSVYHRLATFPPSEGVAGS